MNKTQTMRAITLEDFGGIEKLKLTHVNTPTPAPNEVQIHIVDAAVNPVDWKIRNGLLQQRLPHEFPIIPGWDAAGIVSAVGKNVKKFNAGDEVYAYCRKPTVQWGTYAEYICFDADNVALKPTNLTFAQAAAIPLAGLTAWQSLFDTAKIQKGETVLIHAGSGGVGSLAIQFAKHAGAKVITTTSAHNFNFVKQLGADIVFDYHQPIAHKIHDHFPQGVDIIFDTVGGKTLQESYSLIRKNGRLVTIVEQPNLTLAEKHDILAYYVFVSPNGKQLQAIADLFEKGTVQPIPVEEMSLEDAGAAQEKSEEGHVRGKIVLKIE